MSYSGNYCECLIESYKYKIMNSQKNKSNQNRARHCKQFFQWLNSKDPWKGIQGSSCCKCKYFQTSHFQSQLFYNLSSISFSTYIGCSMHTF